MRIKVIASTFYLLRTKVFEDEISISILINTIVDTFRRFSIKSIRKDDKSIRRLLDYMAVWEGNLIIYIIYQGELLQQYCSNHSTFY